MLQGVPLSLSPITQLELTDAPELLHEHGGCLFPD